MEPLSVSLGSPGGPGRTASPGGPGGATLSAATQRAVWVLSGAVFLQWAGAGAILPLLPLYVRQRGGSDAVVGAVIAGFYVSAFVCQYGSGRLADRLGRLPLVVGGLMLFALASLLFDLPGPVELDVVWRALQGAGAGGAEVAALAMLTRAVPLSHRGRAVSSIYAGQLGGLAVGPMLGSLAGLGSMRWLFVAGGVVTAAAAFPVVLAHRGLEPAAPVDGDEAVIEPPRALPMGAAAASTARRALSGALVGSALVGLTSGVYEACWSLLMIRHHASQWEIGLSWSLFCVPFVALSRPAGWLADHVDRRWLVLVALVWSLAFCATYPFVPGVVPLLVLGPFEALGWVVALPACQSMLGEGTAADAHGRSQGLFASAETAATGLAAAAAGALYGVAAWSPFDGAAALGLAMGLAVLGLWRRVPGRVGGPAPMHATVQVLGRPEL